MNIIDLLKSDGITPTHASRGEFHSPCPFCQGTDRFSTWPERRNSNGKHGGGRGICRQCGWNGDGINYLQKRRGLSFPDAVKALGIDPGPMPERTASRAWQPEPPKAAPGAAWTQKARAFVEHCAGQLKRNSEAVAWLKQERGLSVETIQAAHLGLNVSDKWEDRAAWGLPEEISQKTGKAKKVWTPAGLTIPLIDNQGQVIRIRIRRTVTDSYGRYVNVAGSGMGPMVRWTDQQAVAIVESELDGLLVQQECGDLIGTVAMGSAQAKPDTGLHGKLMNAKRVLCCLDNDEAGQRAAWGHWRIYPGFKRWPPLSGKDPGEMHKAGVLIRAWIEAGLCE